MQELSDQEVDIVNGAGWKDYFYWASAAMDFYSGFRDSWGDGPTQGGHDGWTGGNGESLPT